MAAATKDVLTASRGAMEARLAELKPLVDEYARLEAAVTALDGIAPKSTGNGSAAKPQATSRVKAARKAPKGRLGRPKGSGKRDTQVLEVVKAKPGLTVAEIADMLKMKPNYLYRVLPQLADRGLIVKEGKGWHAVDPRPDAGKTADEIAPF